jgi:hypothetical protein
MLATQTGGMISEFTNSLLNAVGWGKRFVALSIKETTMSFPKISRIVSVRGGKRFSRIFAGMALGLCALIVPGLGCENGDSANGVAQTTDLPDLPQEVRKAVDQASNSYPGPLSGATWSKVHSVAGTDHKVFQLKGTSYRGNKIEMEVTSAGRILEVEEHGIPMSEVPEVVVKALNAHSADFNPTMIEAIYQMESSRPVTYGFERTNAAGVKTEVYITAEGRILTK